MQILKPTKTGISQAVKILKNHGVIVYPTDTAYALGGFFNSPKVIKRILKIKKRTDNKFTLIASSLSQVERFFKLNKTQKQLAKKYWPGPLSIVVSPRFAVRVPKNKIAQNLAKNAGRPIIATSANISGKKTLYNSQQVIGQFKNKKNPRLLRQRTDSARQEPDLILTAGRLPKVKTSTIVQISNNKIKLIRTGTILI